MVDPWAPPTAAQPANVRAALDTARNAGWPRSAAPGRMSLGSVPDARQPVPVTWWVPLIAVIVLAVTIAAILPGTGFRRGAWIAVGTSLVGYAVVRWRIRPGRLRTGPYTWSTTAGLTMDRTDPPTVIIPAVTARPRRTGRNVLLLCNSAAVGLGLTFLWSILTGLLLHPAGRSSTGPARSWVAWSGPR